MKKTIQSLLYTLPGLMLAVGVKTFFSPCVHEDGTAAACAGCGRAVFIVGLALVALAMVRAFLRGKEKAGADILLVLGSLCAFLLPVLLQTCMMQSMRCNAVMKPAVWLISAVGLILFAVTLVNDLRHKERKHA